MLQAARCPLGAGQSWSGLRKLRKQTLPDASVSVHPATDYVCSEPLLSWLLCGRCLCPVLLLCVVVLLCVPFPCFNCHLLLAVV